MPPQLRQRTSSVKPPTYASDSPDHLDLSDILKAEPTDSVNDTPPMYTIDLSLPPSERYRQVATDYKPTLTGLPHLFDQVVTCFGVPISLCHFLARLILRGVYSNEQTEELKGISEVTGLSLYLLVAYNVFLDILMGCTSGAVVVKDPGSAVRMLHFRTLDWGMDPLRQAIVQFNFVESPGGEVIARTIGYVGYIGILTGVRWDLSVSLNFRPYHNDRGWSWGNVNYYWHLLMVLLSYRPSISAVVRDFLLPRAPNGKRKSHTSSAPTVQPPYTGADMDKILPSMPTSAAYIIFCTGEEAIVLEKDHRTAKTRRSSSFISAFNHDIAFETAAGDATTAQAAHAEATTGILAAEFQDLVDGSLERKECLRNRWDAWVNAQHNGTSRKKTPEGVRLEDLKKWMLEYPVCNEETHFVCVMDPREGDFKWVRCFEEGEIDGHYTVIGSDGEDGVEDEGARNEEEGDS